MWELNPYVRYFATKLLPVSFQRFIQNRIMHPYPIEYDQGNFIFIHIYKTAGKSISSAFTRRGACHLSYQAYENILGDKIKDYFIFSFVRNPYDRLVSIYFYLKNGGNNSWKAVRFSKEVMAKYSTFDSFVRNWLDNNNLFTHRMLKPQIYFLLDGEGNLSPDFIGKYENLDEDFQQVASNLNLPVTGLPKKNVSNRRRDWRDYYSDESIEIVGRLYHQDFDLLGYRKKE